MIEYEIKNLKAFLEDRIKDLEFLLESHETHRGLNGYDLKLTSCDMKTDDFNDDYYDCCIASEIIEPQIKLLKNVLKKLGQKVERKGITYCQYGDNRMKPTDVWTNFVKWKPKPMCHNGDSCHVSAPRGSKTGTQGLKGNMERSIIPPALFEEIFKQIGELE